ncbi:MAG: TIGR00730 family Rossman fold protein, partial [Ilumatobacter sp.]|nr:TIGR00730 family Rossman fold protein [Ilumatobacter sp.]
MGKGVPDPIDPRAQAIVSELGVSENVRLAESLVSEAIGLIGDHPDTLDLKIATAALTEMRAAYQMFAPYAHERKVSIFGSARIKPNDPLYAQAQDLAALLADRGWMTVTGAGPGIMQAGMEGAGRERSIGVSIRLPFESGANDIIAGDDKHVSMKYFFTRKLMLIKESQAFVSLPGGFGTLDETFELLTLVQTGKSLPVPIVLLDAPGDPYWEQVEEFIREQLIARGLVSPDDTGLYTITNSCDKACKIIEHFYSNYHSIRFVGERLVVRLQRGPDDAQLADLNEHFAHLVSSGSIERAEPTQAERRDDDHLDLARIGLKFDKHGFGDLIALIGRVNGWPTPTAFIP